LGADFVITPRTFGSLSLNRAWKTYDGDFTSLGYVPPPGREVQTVTGAGVEIKHLVRDGQTVDVSVHYEALDSNDSNFTADRTIWAVGYTWVLK